MPNIRNKPTSTKTFDGKVYQLYVTKPRKDEAIKYKTYLNRVGVKNHLVKMKNGYAIYVR